MRKLIFLFAIITLASCSGETEKGLTEEDIDAYVKQKLDTSEIYDIIQGMRFSKEKESYTAAEYSQNDTTILTNEEIETANKFISRNTYYMNGEPVFIEEFQYPLDETSPFSERKIYLDGEKIIQAYEKEAMTEAELEEAKLSKTEVSFDEFNFERPIDAVNQEGDYEMKYGEFLIIEPQRYLILENPESGYNVALFLLEGDYLIEELYNYPEKYKGTTVFVHHEFMTMNGIERMIYRGGILKEKG